MRKDYTHKFVKESDTYLLNYFRKYNAYKKVAYEIVKIKSKQIIITKIKLKLILI